MEKLTNEFKNLKLHKETYESLVTEYSKKFQIKEISKSSILLLQLFSEKFLCKLIKISIMLVSDRNSTILNIDDCSTALFMLENS